MPKRLLKITNFDKGISLNASQRDPAEGYYPFAENADSAYRGAVRGVQQAVVASGSAAFQADMISTFTVGDAPVLIGCDSSASDALRLYDPKTAAVQTIGNVPFGQAQGLSSVHNGVIIRRGNSEAYFLTYINRTQFGRTLNGYYAERFRLFFNASEDGYAFVSGHPTLANSIGLTPSFSLITSGSYTIVYLNADGEEVSSETLNPASNVGSLVTYTSDPDVPTVFKKGASYAYAVSFMYDGYMEGPLYSKFYGSGYNSANSASQERYFCTRNLRDNALSMRIDLRIYESNTPNLPMQEFINARITGVNIYRAEASDQHGEPIEDFRFVRHISADDENWTNISTGNLRPDYMFTFDDDGYAGATYEENSGIPQTLERAYVDNFNLVTSVNEYLFVANVSSHHFFDATEGMIFRSVAGIPCGFNVLKDFIQLPEPIVALEEHESRLYAFSKSATYRINPSGMYVEGTQKGFGALSSGHVVSTPYGIVQGDEGGVYLNTGNQIIPIGDMILTGGYSSNVGYRDISEANREALEFTYDPRKNRLIILGRYNNTDVKGWMYDLSQQRWDFFAPSNVMQDTSISDSQVADGKLFVTDGVSLYELFTSNTRERLVLVTSDYTFNSDNGEFWLYEAIIRGQLHEDGEFIQYRFNQGAWTQVTPTGGNPDVTLSSSGDTHVIRFGNNPKVKSIQLLLGYFAELDSVHFRVRLPVTED